MKLAYRFAYYLGGFTIGLIILFFFLGGKKTSCDYGPNARVLKNIRIKERLYSAETLTFLRENALDTAIISKGLRLGEVDFSQSSPGLDSCKLYTINTENGKQQLQMKIENCDSIATILKITDIK